MCCVLKCVRSRTTETSQGRPILSSRTQGVFAGEGEEKDPLVKRKVHKVCLYPPVRKVSWELPLTSYLLIALYQFVWLKTELCGGQKITKHFILSPLSILLNDLLKITLIVLKPLIHH